MNKMTIDDVNLKSKKVLVRVDFNVPIENGIVTDSTRIIESIPTIKKILSDGGKAILMSHLGRPKGKPDLKYSLLPVAKKASEILGIEVKFASDCIGEVAKNAVANMKDGECLLLENLRFHPDEEENNETFARELASLGDLYVNDAFGSAHRAHASTEGITKFISPSVAGYLMQKELNYLGKALVNPDRPFTAILGGAKVSGKIDVIQNLLGKVDTLIIGGGMAYTFFKAKGLEIGNSLVEADKIDLAKSILSEIANKNIKFLLPVDCIIADDFKDDANKQVVKVTDIKPGWQGMDIGPETIKLFTQEILQSKTVVWNGPLGVFEMNNFATGTNEIAKALAEATQKGATTVVGGGDSAAAISKIGLDKSVSHVSTGGGASLEFLEGKILPGVAALTNK